MRAARNLEVKHNKNISAICPTAAIEKKPTQCKAFTFPLHQLNQNGEEYPGKTLRQLLLAFKMYPDKREGCEAAGEYMCRVSKNQSSYVNSPHKGIKEVMNQ